MKYLIFGLLILKLSWAVGQNQKLALVSNVWPPFTNEKEERKIALDLVEMALNRAGYEVDYQILKFEEVLKGIKSKNFDGSAALWKDNSRMEYLNYSIPYLHNQLILVGRKGSKVNVKLDELENNKLGLVKNYSYGDELKSSKAQLVYSNDAQGLLDKLLQNEVDYILIDALLVEYLSRYQQKEVSKYLEIAPKPIFYRSLYFTLRKGLPNSKQIIEDFNEEIKSMVKDGSYNEVLEVRWIETDIDGDGWSELVSFSSQGGVLKPMSSYRVPLESDSKETDTELKKYYVNGTLYDGWDKVPEEYKKEKSKEEEQAFTILEFRF
mgnify:CR=1 FL=1